MRGIRGRAAASQQLLLALLWGACTAYVFIILAAPSFGPNDDYQLLTTVMAGRWYPPDWDASVGRFVPLSEQELNLVSLLARGPFAFYLFNAAELLGWAALFFDLVRRFSGTGPAAASVLLVLLTPGFADAWLRLNVNERDVLFLLTAYLWCYFAFERRRSGAFAVIAILTANLALYEKEPCFIALGAFALSRFAGGPPSDRGMRRIDLLTLLSCAAFALVYYLLVYRHWGADLYGGTEHPALFAIRNIAKYASTDPLLLFLLAPAALWRLQALARRTVSFDRVADPLLLSALAWMIVLLLLNIANRYYWLPAYALAMPGLARLWSADRQRRMLWRGFAALALLVTAVSAVPYALFMVSFDKYVPRNWSAMSEVLSGELLARDGGPRTTIIFDGLQAEDEPCVSLRAFLAYRGVPAAQFEVRGEPHRDDGALSSGDILIVAPETSIDPDTRYLHAIEMRYRLLWRSASPLALPDLSLHALGKYFAAWYLGPDSGVSANFRDPVDFLVYVKR